MARLTRPFSSETPRIDACSHNVVTCRMTRQQVLLQPRLWRFSWCSHLPLRSSPADATTTKQSAQLYGPCCNRSGQAVGGPTETIIINSSAQQIDSVAGIIILHGTATQAFQSMHPSCCAPTFPLAMTPWEDLLRRMMTREVLSRMVLSC